MLGFLQGFAYGLFITCMPWFITGMIRPRLALPTDPPRRLHVWLRYGLAAPFLAFLLWTTSLWGGFSPSIAGWIAGLIAIPAELFIERRWRAWRAARAAEQREAERDRAAARQREALEREEREAGLEVLDPAQPPQGADDIVRALCAAKQALLDVRRPDLATAADRIHTRYAHARRVIASKFDPRELTFERAAELVAEVCRGTLDKLATMRSLAHGTAGIDADFVRRRLQRDGPHLDTDERQALEHRLHLIDSTEQRLRTLRSEIEAALTALDDTTVAVAALETARPQASVAAEQALGDLRRFVENAGLYGR